MPLRTKYLCALLADRHMEIKPRYFLQLAYNGTQFRGWQRQPEAPSVQEAVERALRTILHLPELYVVGCGRTDTGVHALAQVVHFDTETVRPLDAWVRGVNATLPPSVAVLWAQPVTDEFHARFSARVSLILRKKDAFMADRAHVLHPALDVDAMNEACKHLIGKQDLTSFCKAGSDAKTMICDVRVAEWETLPNGYRFRIHADRFLRNMVRAIVGTCIRIGKGQAQPESMLTVIAANPALQALGRRLGKTRF